MDYLCKKKLYDNKNICYKWSNERLYTGCITELGREFSCRNYESHTKNINPVLLTAKTDLFNEIDT